MGGENTAFRRGRGASLDCDGWNTDAGPVSISFTKHSVIEGSVPTPTAITVKMPCTYIPTDPTKPNTAWPDVLKNINQSILSVPSGPTPAQPSPLDNFRANHMHSINDVMQNK